MCIFVAPPFSLPVHTLRVDLIILQNIVHDVFLLWVSAAVFLEYFLNFPFLTLCSYSLRISTITQWKYEDTLKFILKCPIITVNITFYLLVDWNIIKITSHVWLMIKCNLCINFKYHNWTQKVKFYCKEKKTIKRETKLPMFVISLNSYIILTITLWEKNHKI